MRGKRTRNHGVPVACATTAQSLPLQDDADFAASQRSHVVMKFVSREGGDHSILIARELIWERTGFNTKVDDSIRIIDAVCAEVEPANKSLASSEVAVAGALDTIFGRSGRANMRKKRPFASKTTMPFGLMPYDWTLLPFGRACSQEASVQVPTSWSLSDHCWLMALLGNAVSPNTMIAKILRTLRRFMFPSPWC
jgi:hypothetical protein